MKWFGDIAKVMSHQAMDSGVPFPRGYGIAYSKYDSFTYILYPIPINFIVSLVRRIWFAFLGHHYAPSFIEEIAMKSYEKGKKDTHAWYDQYYKNMLASNNKKVMEALKAYHSQQHNTESLQ